MAISVHKSIGNNQYRREFKVLTSAADTELENTRNKPKTENILNLYATGHKTNGVGRNNVISPNVPDNSTAGDTRAFAVERNSVIDYTASDITLVCGNTNPDCLLTQSGSANNTVFLHTQYSATDTAYYWINDVFGYNFEFVQPILSNKTKYSTGRREINYETVENPKNIRVIHCTTDTNSQKYRNRYIPGIKIINESNEVLKYTVSADTFYTYQVIYSGEYISPETIYKGTNFFTALPVFNGIGDKLSFRGYWTATIPSITKQEMKKYTSPTIWKRVEEGLKNQSWTNRSKSYIYSSIKDIDKNNSNLNDGYILQDYCTCTTIIQPGQTHYFGYPGLAVKGVSDNGLVSLFYNTHEYNKWYYHMIDIKTSRMVLNNISSV